MHNPCNLGQMLAGNGTEAYTLALQQERQQLEAIMDLSSQSHGEMIESLKAVVHGAARKAGLQERPRVSKKAGRSEQHSSAATSMWYGQECREAYKRLQKAWADKRASIRATDSHRGEANWHEELQAMRSYKAAVQRAKRRYTKERQAHLADILQNKPRQFWRLAKQNPKHADGLTKQAWYAYFSKLRNPVAATQPAHALKFMVAAPTAEAVQQAELSWKL